MIETKEQYEETLDFLKINRFAYDEANEIDDLIKALRKVLRLADQMDTMMARHVQDTPTWDLVYQIVEAYRAKANDLPDWIKEDG